MSIIVVFQDLRHFQPILFRKKEGFAVKAVGIQERSSEIEAIRYLIDFVCQNSRAN